MPKKRTPIIIISSLILFFFIWTILAFTGNFLFSAATLFLQNAQTGSMDIDFTNALTLIKKLYPWYAMAGVIALGMAVKIAVKMHINFRQLAKEQKGSRRWTTLPELKEEYRSVPESGRKYSGKSGFPVSRYKNRIFIDDSPVNNLIIGTTRSGKGEAYIVPAIDIYSRAKGINRPSIVVADPKGELAAASRETLEARGYDVHILDLLTFQGLSYNPLELVKDTYLRGDIAEAQTLTDTISHILFNDPHAHDKTWNNWSIALTNALILAVVIDCCTAAKGAAADVQEAILQKINLYSVVRLLTDLGASDDEGDSEKKLPIDSFFSTRDESDIARMQYAAINFASAKTRGNIFANTLSILTKFTMDSIAKMTALNSLDFLQVGFDEKKPTAIFLVTPDYDSSKNFLVTMFISQLYFVLAKRASLTKGGKCCREVVFLLDEFGNIPPIPNMAGIITVCLGRNIKFTMAIQAYSQLYEKYGKEAAQTIIGNCGNQIYLLTIENDTASYFSRLIGDETITVTSRSGGAFSLQKSLSEHVDKKPLLNPNELMELTPGESVIVRVTKRSDRRGHDATPRPIFNRDKSRMKYRYEYLDRTFDTAKSFNDIFQDYPCLHKVIDLQQLCYSAAFADAPLPDIPTPTVKPLIWEQLSPEDKRFLEKNIPERRLGQMVGSDIAAFERGINEIAASGEVSEALIEALQRIAKKVLGRKSAAAKSLIVNEQLFFPYLSGPERNLIRRCLPDLPMEQLGGFTVSDFLQYIEENRDCDAINKGKYAELKRLFAHVCDRAQNPDPREECL